MKDEIKFRKKWNVVASRKLLTNFVCVILFGLLPLFLWAQAPQPPVIQDTIPQDSLLRISVLAPDSTQQILADSLKQAFRDSMQRSAELKSRVNYHARDSIIFDLDGKLLQLYGEVSLDYEDIKLTADRVTIDWGTNTLYAEGTPDTSGQIIGQPQFDEGGQKYLTEKIVFNFNTRKGRITGGRTQQDENFVIGDTIKRNPDNSYYIQSGKITTCDLEHPHFYIYSNRMKVIPNDKVVMGRVNLIVEDVPTPLILPFGFFPNKKGKKSGILMPAYGVDATRGYFLREGGYYQSFGDYVDAALRGDIYSYGSYRLNLASRYALRYKFTGGIDLSFANNNNGDKNNAEYTEQRDFFIKWRHDQTLGKSARINGDVNLGSSTYLSLNSNNIQDIVNNTLLSNISYNKTFGNSPWNLSSRISYQQNTSQKTVTLDLPSIGINRGRTFPFKRKLSGSKEYWYEKIGYSYSFQFQNRINTYDSILFTPAGNKLFQNGIQHSIPVSMNFKALKYITFSPSFNYTEQWYNQEIRNQSRRDTLGNFKLMPDTIPGLVAIRQFTAGISAATRVYGMIPFHSYRQRIIRHTLTPSIGYNYRPDFSELKWNNYYAVYDSLTKENKRFSRGDGQIFGGAPRGTLQSINFSIINLLEMRYNSIKRNQDTLQESPIVKKITILDNLGINGFYNFAADSLKLSPINFSARTVLLKELLNVNLTAVMDPYTQDTAGVRINKYRFESGKVNDKNKIGYINASNLAISTSFRSKKENKPMVRKESMDSVVYAEIQKHKEQYIDFNIPWSFNLTYNLLYTKPKITEKATINQSVAVSGDLNLTEKWKIRISSGYDFVSKDLIPTNISVLRDLHCWEASFTSIPFGLRKYFMLTIQAKSSMLQDLKLTKQRPPNFQNLLD